MGPARALRGMSPRARAGAPFGDADPRPRPEDNIRDEAALMLMRMVRRSPTSTSTMRAPWWRRCGRCSSRPARRVSSGKARPTDNDYMALLLEGEVRAETSTGSGRRVVISVIGPGSLIGEMGVIDGKPALGQLHRDHRRQARRALACCFDEPDRDPPAAAARLMLARRPRGSPSGCVKATGGCALCRRSRAHCSLNSTRRTR